MSEFERYIPPEARQETETEKPEKANLKPETIHNIQGGPLEASAESQVGSRPESTGERIHWHAPDGNLITPEKEEIYRSPETLPEKEPGYGPKASHRGDPNQTISDSQSSDDTGDG